MSTISNAVLWEVSPACRTLKSELIALGESRGRMIASAPKPWKHLSDIWRRLYSLNECQSAVQFSIIFRGLGWGESRERKRCFGNIEEAKHKNSSKLSFHITTNYWKECSHKHCDWAHLIHCLSISHPSPAHPSPTPPPTVWLYGINTYFSWLLVDSISDPNRQKERGSWDSTAVVRTQKNTWGLTRSIYSLVHFLRERGNFQDKHNFFMSYWIKSSNLQVIRLLTHR